MNKIVSFKKEIPFSNLFEITSISLEHTYEIDNYNVVGDFIVSGEYRNFSTSINTIEFNKRIPFSIEIFDKYDITNLTVDIDDFNYEIMDNKILMVNIDLILDNLEEKEERDISINCVEEEDILPPEEKRDDVELENEFSLEENYEDNIKQDIQKDINVYNANDDIVLDNSININIEPEEKIKSLFTNINNEETYKTYKIYIVRENDTIESIMEKYKITKDSLELYNNISDVKINDKIIIPNEN